MGDADARVFVSWRLLATDSPDVTFNVYRRTNDGPAVKLNERPLSGATHFVDSAATMYPGASYSVRSIVDGVEQPASEAFRAAAATSRGNAKTLVARSYLSIPLQPRDGYHANDASVGDLDGDGEYEIVVHMVGVARDNSQGGFTSEPILEAYKLSGQRLWSINLGKNIREGAHYTQFLVFDFDGDGRAEVVCKTADGTVDGQGRALGDANADHRSKTPASNSSAEPPASTTAPSPAPTPSQAAPKQAAPKQADGRATRGQRGKAAAPREGYVLKGPEFLTVFDGVTGAALATTDYVPGRGDNLGRIWGDDYGNRVDRFLACVAYLDGRRPSFVMCRGYYTRTVLAAWDWRDGKLTQRWVFDTDDGRPENRDYRGQGNHNLSVADVDGDGKDEIVYGSCVIDDDGRGLVSTKLGHGDALHVSDLDPTRPGLEVWGIHENERQETGRPGVALYDARTGEVLFQSLDGEDVGRGMAADIDPRHPGAELWCNKGGLWSSKGKPIGPRPRSTNMAIWWDGDEQRELLDGVTITKWDYVAGREVRIFTGRDHGLASNNGTKANPCLSADFLGDWREELLARTADNKELRIYTTTIPTEIRRTTLMHDSHYRLSIAWQNVGYNQPPHASK